ncbi:MAG: glycosyltransferase family 2 protein [Phycisphaerales bacterium]|nr:glycosyltransferase family 2 protein [Phycisphaerales bacterium]
MPTQTKLSSISIFFPFYNEEANIQRVAQSALRIAPTIAERFEIILVNDGSRDATGAIADRLAAKHPEIRAVHNRPNRGYGGAVRRGFDESRMDWVFFSDGDGQFDLAELPKLIALLANCDMAVGYRMHRADPLPRRLNAFCWGTLVRALFGIRVRDIDCAFKLIPRRLLDDVTLESDGAMISTELLARATYRGLSIDEVGVHHYPRTAGEQTGANFRVILKAFRELFALHGKLRRDAARRPSRHSPQNAGRATTPA